MNALRDQYFAALKSSCKQLVSKSALGPQIVALRDANNRIVGFSSAEHLSPDHPEIAPYLKREVCKSAAVAAEHPNSVFDDFFDDWFPEQPTVKTETKKSAADPADKNAILNPCVPMEFLRWPI